MSSLSYPALMDSVFLLYDIAKKSVGLEDTGTMRAGLNSFYPDLDDFRLACYRNLPVFKKEYEEIKRLEKLIKGTVDSLTETFGEGNVDDWVNKYINERLEKDGAKA